MRQSSSFSLFFLATLAILLTSLIVPANCDLCADADYKHICRTVLKGVREPRKGLEIMINNLIRHITFAKSRASKHGKDDKAKTCVETYDSALDDLNKSKKFLKANDIGSLRIRLSAVISDLESCNDAYSEKGKRSPFKAYNTFMEHATDNALLVSQQLKAY